MINLFNIHALLLIVFFQMLNHFGEHILDEEKNHLYWTMFTVPQMKQHYLTVAVMGSIVMVVEVLVSDVKMID